MVEKATLIGTGLGVAVQLYANAVQKLPLMRSPWQHVIAGAAGAAFATWLVKFEKQTEADLAAMLKKRDEANARLRS